MEGNGSRIILAVVIVAIAAVAITFILTTDRSRDSLSDDARLILSIEDIGLINQGLATNGSVSLPMAVESAPTGCPNSNSDHCIWVCTDWYDDPLGGLDDDTCPNDVWLCGSCGTIDDPDVCETGEGERIPCPKE